MQYSKKSRHTPGFFVFWQPRLSDLNAWSAQKPMLAGT
jgi:hypothetical protein